MGVENKLPKNFARKKIVYGENRAIRFSANSKIASADNGGKRIIGRRILVKPFIVTIINIID